MTDIVIKARDMGHYTIVVDREANSPAKRFADKAVLLSTDQIDELEQLCRDERVDGVLNGFEDFNIHVACELCSRLGLPFYATKEQLQVATNKVSFKDVCRHHGVPVIEQYILEQAQHEGRYPYIVKPTDSYGSRGISVCRNAAELEDGYKKATSASRSSAAIIERFVDTDHGVELFYTIVNGNIHLTVTADRYTFCSSETTVPLPVAEVFPSRHRYQMVDQLDAQIRQMLMSMGLKNGLVLIQALYDTTELGDEYFVYEMAYRLTGEQHYILVSKQNNIDLGKMMVRLALGEDVSDYDTPLLDDTSFVRPSINLAAVVNSGRIQKIEGMEKIQNIGEMVSCNLIYSNNDIIHSIGDYSHILFRANMVADSYEQLTEAVEQVANHLTVVSDKGDDMLLNRFHLPKLEQYPVKIYHERLFQLQREKIVPCVSGLQLDYVKITADNLSLVEHLRGKEYVQQFEYQLSQGDFGYYVFFEGRPIGYGWVKHPGSDDFFFDIGENCCYLCRFFVHESMRGHGIYPELLNTLISRESECNLFFIAAERGNEASERGLRKVGFSFLSEFSFVRAYRKTFNKKRLTDTEISAAKSINGIII